MLKGSSALTNASRLGRAHVVAYLLDQGAGINEISESKKNDERMREAGIKNALCMAAWQGHSHVLDLLLERGADLSAKDSKGRTALELAEIAGHESYVAILNRTANFRQAK